MRYCHACGGHVIISIGSIWSEADYCSIACSKKYSEKIEQEAKKETDGEILEYLKYRPQ